MKDVEELLKTANDSIEVEYVEPRAILEKVNQVEEKPVIRPFWTKPKMALVSAFALASIAMAIILPASLASRGSVEEIITPEQDSHNRPAEYSQNHSSSESSSIVLEVYEEREMTATVLRAKANTGSFQTSENSDGFKQFVNKINNYAYPLLVNLNTQKNAEKKNVAFSPASIFYALSMLSRVTSGQDKTNLLSILGVTESEISSYMPSLYRACNRTYSKYDVELGKESINNSVWFDEKYNFNDTTLDDLANAFFTDSFYGDFLGDNAKINQNISNYVYNSTEGLLNPNYNFSKNTAFVLLNTLFFKDTWDISGEPLYRAERNKPFTQFNGQTAYVDYYQTYSVPAKIHVTDKYESLYAVTENGFKIDFMVPLDGVNVEELFTPEVLREHENYTYFEEETVPSETNPSEMVTKSYVGDVLFPEFEASFDGDILETFKSSYNIGDITNFGDFVTRKDGVPTEFSVSSIVHTTKVEVKKDTVKGAAASGIEVGEASGIPVNIRQKLIVDRSFVYTIKNPLGIKLFEGVVYFI